MEFMGYLLIVGIIATATSRSWLSPSTSYELLNHATPMGSCRDGTEEERGDAEISNYGKAATFSLSGLYRCERKLFEYGERNSFISMVAEAAPIQADIAARKIKAIIFDRAKIDQIKHRKLVLDVTSDVDSVIPLVESAYQTAFTQRLKNITILKQNDVKDPDLYRVKVNILRVDDVNNILQTTFTWPLNGNTHEVSI